MIYLQTTYELCFGKAYFESCDFSRENTNIDVSVFMFDLRMIKMSSECEYGWCWKISACLTEYEVCDSFASLTRHQSSYSGSAGWYFRYQSIHIQITYTYHQLSIVNGFCWYIELKSNITAILRYFPLILRSDNFPSHASRVRWKIIASN
jgi:hypothetical protein